MGDIVFLLAALSQALSYWHWAIEELRQKYIPQNVADFVGTYIKENYTGTPPMSRKWVYAVSGEFW